MFYMVYCVFMNFNSFCIEDKFDFENFNMFFEDLCSLKNLSHSRLK